MSRGVYPNEAGELRFCRKGRLFWPISQSCWRVRRCSPIPVWRLSSDPAATLSEEEIRMVSKQPLELFDLPQGDLRPGDRSNVTLFDFGENNTRTVIVATVSGEHDSIWISPPIICGSYLNFTDEACNPLTPTIRSGNQGQSDVVTLTTPAPWEIRTNNGHTTIPPIGLMTVRSPGRVCRVLLRLQLVTQLQMEVSSDVSHSQQTPQNLILLLQQRNLLTSYQAGAAWQNYPSLRFENCTPVSERSRKFRTRVFRHS